MPQQKDENLKLMLKELIAKIAGKNTEAIVDILFGKKNVNEFKIAEKLKITINQVRNILYRISSYSILESIRKKDKRKGWYTYFWTLNIAKALETYSKIKAKEIELLEQVLKSYQLKQFYSCPQDKIEMSEETAMQHNFLCPECGMLLQPIVKEKKLKEINSKIEANRKELQMIQQELEKYKPKPIVKPIKKVKKKIKKKAKVKKKESKKTKIKLKKLRKKAKVKKR